jgi:hypothetical protein
MKMPQHNAEWPPERLDPAGEHEQLCRVRVEHAVPVREPLVLVSQIQRSGGTLLSQLFDGHPECHAHPQELKIGYPTKRGWPALDLDRPDAWFDRLWEWSAAKHAALGYQKPAERPESARDVFPFLFLPRLQRQVFEACIAAKPVERQRDVLDCYFTSYFNAWVDNHNLYTGPKRVVTAFTAGLAADAANVERFFSTYPDGTLISIVRNPRGWYASARKHKNRFRKVEPAIARWRQSTEAALAAGERYGDRVLVITYEDLVLDTEATMGRIAARIGIAMLPSLLMPTFNGRPIRANSSQPVPAYGVLPDRTSAFRDTLEPETIELIEERAGDLYERAAALTLERVP